MRIFPRIDLNNKDDRNAYFLVIEIFWASLLAAAASFNSAYAIRLGAENVQVGLLSSLPALFAIIISIPAGVFLQSRTRRKPWILASISVHRFSFFLVALVPFIKFLGIPTGDLVVWVLVLGSIPAHIFNVGWIPMMAEVTQEERRTAIFSARNIIYNASFSVCTFLFGLWLKNIELPINYQTLYFVGFLASCVSTFFILKIDVPDSTSISKTKNLGSAIREQVNTFREAFHDHPDFIRITRNTLLHGIGLWMAGPVYSLYYVKTLQADDAWIGLQGTVLSAATIAGYALWRWLLKRWGEPDSLKRTIVLAGIYPILAGLIPSLNLILLVVALNGLISPGINLSHFNTLLKVTPEGNRPGYTALYMTIVNFGAFISPMIGVAIAAILGTGPTLVVCGILSVIGSTSFWFWPVKSPKPVLA
jgi:MFS family permease